MIEVTEQERDMYRKRIFRSDLLSYQGREYPPLPDGCDRERERLRSDYLTRVFNRSGLFGSGAGRLQRSRSLGRLQPYGNAD